MPHTTSLLVEDDAQIAWGVSRAIEARGFQGPHHVTNAKDAIYWLAHNDCGVCFLAYKLPDMTGVDLTRQLRQRKPDLPIYMLSGAGSESVAVAAFRAGVSDYFVKDAQVYDAAARVVQQVSLEQAKVATVPTTPSFPEGLPPELLNLTYQNRLRVIGRQLDVNRYRLPSIFEVDGGFIVRAIPEHGRTADALEFPDRDFFHWVTGAYHTRGKGERGASMSPLLPSGYEDFLRAIGAALDQHEAETVTISEFASIIVVGGSARLDNTARTTVGNLQWILKKDDIDQILDEGYRRRRKVETPKDQPGSVLDRIFGRPSQFRAVTA